VLTLSDTAFSVHHK